MMYLTSFVSAEDKNCDKYLQDVQDKVNERKALGESCDCVTICTHKPNDPDTFGTFTGDVALSKEKYTFQSCQSYEDYATVSPSCPAFDVLDPIANRPLRYVCDSNKESAKKCVKNPGVVAGDGITDHATACESIVKKLPDCKEQMIHSCTLLSKPTCGMPKDIFSCDHRSFGSFSWHSSYFSGNEGNMVAHTCLNPNWNVFSTSFRPTSSLVVLVVSMASAVFFL